MTVEHVLHEYRDGLLALGPEDAAALERETRGLFEVRVDLRSGELFVNPRQFVGVVGLPSGARVRVVPKVPAGNLFVMLATAADLPSPFRDEASELAEIDDILDVLADAFAAMVEERIAAGLHRAYVEREDDLAAVRGRIAVAEDLRRNLVSRQRTFCRFAELSWDTPENQVVRQVVHLLAGWVRAPKTRLRLWQIDHALGEVTPTHHPASVVDRFVYDRQNRGYEPIHRLCKLFLEGFSLSEHAGGTAFRSFLIDMNALFEQFVSEILRERAPAGIEVAAQHRDHLDLGRTLPIRPDLVVRRGRAVALAADCKYKRTEGGQLLHHDVYQVLAYCTALGVDRGLVAYPRHEDDAAADLAIRNSAVRIRKRSIDLGGDRHALRRAADTFAAEVFAWAGA